MAEAGPAPVEFGPQSPSDAHGAAEALTSAAAEGDALHQPVQLRAGARTHDHRARGGGARPSARPSAPGPIPRPPTPDECAGPPQSRAVPTRCPWTTSCTACGYVAAEGKVKCAGRMRLRGGLLCKVLRPDAHNGEAARVPRRWALKARSWAVMRVFGETGDGEPKLAWPAPDPDHRLHPAVLPLTRLLAQSLALRAHLGVEPRAPHQRRRPRSRGEPLEQALQTHPSHIAVACRRTSSSSHEKHRASAKHSQMALQVGFTIDCPRAARNRMEDPGHVRVRHGCRAMRSVQ